jgi:sugar lactone lactonase YvrE
MKADLELIARDDLLGEGPFWDAAQQRLVWSDVKSATIYAYSPKAGRKEVVSKGVMAFSIVGNKDGALLITGPTGLHHYRPGGEPASILSEHQGEALFINDAIAEHRGRVYAGTVYWGPSGLVKTGKLYLIDGPGSAKVVDEGIKMANGLGFSPDEKTLYFTDSLARVIYAYDVHPETGELSRKRIFVQIPATEGMPDGMTVDAEGHVWSAQWYGGQVVRYDPDGKVAGLKCRCARSRASCLAGRTSGIFILQPRAIRSSASFVRPAMITTRGTTAGLSIACGPG